MSNLSELPGQHTYRTEFISKYPNINNEGNLVALSHCYANYKVLGVLYPHEIMTKLREFDEVYGIKIEDSFLKVKEVKVEVKSQPSFYKPKKFCSAQNVAGFPFINFVKSLDNTDNSVITQTLSVETEVLNSISNIRAISPIKVPVDEEFVMFNDALNDSPIKDSLKKFQSMYIQMKVIDASLLSTEKIINLISSKCDLQPNFKFVYDQKNKEGTCTIIINDVILLGKGRGIGKKIATDEALADFHRRCVKDVNVSKQIDETVQCFPPEETSDSDFEGHLNGAEMIELDFLKDFYIKNNRSNNATSILLEAFQFFKMSMSFKELVEDVHMIVNDSSIAFMPFDESFSNTKLLLSNFVLRNLENTKFTLMKNTCYINQFEDSVDKGGMYDTNLKDHTKIDSTMNVGGQLMLKMGWNENSGLGKSGAGIIDPIINDGNGKRVGLGFDLGSSKDMKSFANNVSKCLRDWLNEDGDDVIFDRNFDNKERAAIHKECRKLGVMSKSHNNTNGDRFLVVSKYRSPQELLQWVMSKGGKTRLYTLLPPGFRKIHTDVA